ncbi:MAG: hypothetical protein J7K23_01060 [Thermoproteales archaeon]|nr:hypothetical protein [Thermoproteales archaeon]
MSKDSSLVHEPFRFMFNELETNWVILDGDGKSRYTRDSINVVYKNKKMDLPNDILVLKKKIVEEKYRNTSRSKKYCWNGPSFCVKKFFIGRINGNLALSLFLGLSDYYNFLATQMMLDVDISDIPPDPFKTPNPSGRTLRERYFVNNDFLKPNVYLANAFAVNVLLVTNDNMAVFTRRSDFVSIRKNYFDCSFTEGFHPILDKEKNSYSVYKCVARGTFEEIGVRPKYDDIMLLDFGVDTKYYIYAVQGYARVDATSKEILDCRVSIAKDAWETKNVFFVPFKTEKIFKFMYRHGPWASPTLANIYYVLVDNFGYDKVNKVLKRFPRFYKLGD